MAFSIKNGFCIDQFETKGHLLMNEIATLKRQLTHWIISLMNRSSKSFTLNSFLCCFIFFFTNQVNAAQLPDFTALIEEASPAVVKINTIAKTRTSNLQLPQGQQIPDIFRHFLDPRQSPERESRAMGSGFFVSSDGYILTNNHVIDNADEISVRLTDRREYSAEVIGTDRRSDLALLKIDQKGLPFLRFADAKSLKVGAWVVAIGSPFGLDFSASAGIISAMGRSIPTERNENYVPFIQTDVAINPGNSGGPLFNMSGEVVGVNSQIITPSGGSVGLSFAIPSSVAQNVIQQIKDKGHVDRGWLGVVIQDVDRDLAESFGLDKPMGALVAEVADDAPAGKGGIEAGDVIIEFNGVEILTSGELPHVVGATPPDERVSVIVMRQGKKKTLKVRVGVLPTADSEPKQSSTNSKKTNGGRLGLVVEDLDSETQSEISINGGVLVREVIQDSPAAQAGLRSGDVISQIGFSDVKNISSFKKVVSKLPKGKALPVRFYRNGRPAFRSIMID